MPKMKSHQGATERFEVRKKGKLRRQRRLNTETLVNPKDAKRIKRLLGVR